MADIIVCIGGINLDRKLRPLAALVEGSSNPCQAHESPGGVARNIAESLARLGQPVALLGAVGDDLIGQGLLAQAERQGIDTHGILRLRVGVTDSYTALLSADGDLHLGLAAMPMVERLTPWALAPSQALRRAAGLVVADGNLPPATLAHLITEAREGPPLVIVCVSEAKMARLPAELQGVHLLILNRGELATIDTDADAALAALHRRGVQRVLVTQGPAGIRLSEAGTQLSIPARRISTVVDVSGAGDALAAGVCYRLVRQRDGFAQAAELGLDLAALTLQTEFSVHPDLDPSFIR